jgi:hypothetical protein
VSRRNEKLFGLARSCLLLCKDRGGLFRTRQFIIIETRKYSAQGHFQKYWVLQRSGKGSSEIGWFLNVIWVGRLKIEIAVDLAKK